MGAMHGNTSIFIARVAFFVLLGYSTASEVLAQPAAPGTGILAVDAGAVTASAGNALATADRVQVTVRESDSVLNGALIGAGVAVASGLFLCTRTEPWANCRDDVGPMLKIGAIGAGIGIAIDLLIRERRTIYEAAPAATRLSAAPLIARRGAGLQVALGF